MKSRRMILLAALLVGQSAFAQFYQNGADPSVRWSERQSAHFRIVYPEETDSLARAYLLALERWRPSVGISAGQAPGSLQWGKTPVILHPFNPYSNGSVAWAPKRMDLYTHPEAYGSLPQSWMTQLTVHESRHLAQMQLAYRRPFRWVNYLLGEMWPGAVSALFTPPALLEGDAVVAETALTASGRGRSADFLNYYHLAFDNGDWRDWYQWVYGSFRKAGPDYYAVGYLTVAGMRTFYDRPAFTAEYFDRVCRQPFPVAPFQRFVRGVSGQSFKDTFRGLQERFHAIWTEEADARGPFMEMEQVTKKHAFATDYSNGSWIDDCYYAVKEAKDQASRLVRIDTDGTEHDLGPFAADVSSLNAGTHRLYWSETIPGKRWTLDGDSIIRYVDTDGKRHDLTRDGRLYNPQPGPDGTVAAVEFPVRGGSNIVILSEEDGRILKRIPAPENVELYDPAWVEESLYSLGVDDRGFSIWRLDGEQWTCVLEPTLQTMENLDGEDHVLDFVSDRSGVKELYRYDPASGRAWQLTSSRYGGTDYFWHGDTLWFNAITPEGTAIFKARAPEPREVDIRAVKPDRVAERLSAQERVLVDAAGGAETETLAVSEPRRYHKPLHLMKFHSWAPLYFNYDNVASLSLDTYYETASPGLTGLFQNDLGTAWGTVGYSAHPDPESPSEWRHSGHVQFTYTGLYPVLEATFDLYDKGGAQYSFQERNRKVGPTSYAILGQPADGVFWQGGLTAYIPFRHHKGGIQTGWIPQVSWSVSSSRFQNGTLEMEMLEDFVKETDLAAFTGYQPGQNVLMQNLRGSVRAYRMLPAADSQVYPRWGIGAEVGGSFRPGLSSIYSPAWYGYVYGYVPGLTRTQGLRLTAMGQVQHPTGAPFGENSVTVWPRGFTAAEGRTVARRSARQLRLTADYAVPVYIGDLSWFSPVAYVKNLLVIPYADWMTFGGARNGKGSATTSSLLSLGADLTVELANFLWFPFPCSVGVSASWQTGPYYASLLEADPSRKPYAIELIFSLDI